MRSPAALLLLAAACSSPRPAPPPVRDTAPLPAGDLQPLAVGMSWEYAGASGERHIHRITGREKVGRFDCFVLEIKTGQDVQRYWLRMEPDGLKQYRVQNGTLPPRDIDDVVIHVPVPPKVGARWEYDADYGLISLHHVGTVETIETIKVPAGEFRCVRVRTVGTTEGATMLVRVAWYAPGVGLVKEDSKLNVGAGDIQGRIALKEFKR